MRASQLLFMTNIVKDLLPKFALIENVSSVPVEIKNQSIKILQNAGYHVVAKIVRALDYGSVQIRRRWILTAVKDKHIYPEPSYSNRTAKEILTGEKSELTMTEDVRTGLKNLKSGHWVALPGQNWKGFFIIDPNKPLPAIINCNKDKYVRPDRQEYLSFHEIALAQGFPWNYRFFGTNTSIGQQLANAVPVELARSFVHVLFQHFNKNI
jgi:DNA (cytosine-5)-methyltransferase 1